MRNPLLMITGSSRPLHRPLVLNLFYFMSKGAVFGILYLVIETLLAKGAVLPGMRRGILAGMALIAILQVMFGILVHSSAYKTAFRLTADARIRLADHLRTLSMGFFRNHDPGEISSLLLQDMEKCEHVFSHFFIDTVAAILFPVLLLTGFWFLDPVLTLVLAAGLIPALPVLLVARSVVGRMGQKQMAATRQVVSGILEYVEGIRVLKSLNRTGSAFSRLDHGLTALRDQSFRLEAAGGIPVVLYQLFLELAFPLVILAAGWRYGEGEIGVAVFAAFLVIGYRCLEPLQTAGSFTAELRYMFLAADRIATVMETPPLPATAQPVSPDGYGIQCENVQFGYGKTPVIAGLSAGFAEGRLTAVVGPSGSGKSTLTRLIARFWDVDGGRITIGGADIREIGADCLTDAISVVFQDVYLFDDTIAANIRLADPDASDERVEAAAKAACCDFIRDLPDGFATRVGEGGAHLSGGQRQRISIARALIKDAPIVILDEATAALDPENEAAIQVAVDRLVKDRTVIVIAHRLRTIARAHCIHVLDDGKVVESGTHKELIAADGRYRRLWDAQEQAGHWRVAREKRQASA